ncbi:type I site-specific deoxyribonuclease, HsdR family [Levilactobacillus senmaizukei DSM 21775 = NBRC 103853]|uniref:Type I restriction enzyme endonuclease subunit n=1 Tax=Levilactobacillus senmaizukei DSM 21775 = NBRC 103853 TaxID=1423803 RepID=A0A0R2DF93_9LACO|nr:HsdR family type I site-specific deoxyribonuclease [Levilactobacillus senmaizukei]KRN02246.1 type I site-specific deoxyribonuclease, HsdR family [Levilactobacillus senmaizukei DSM 21775 = NBRC 103853]
MDAELDFENKLIGYLEQIGGTKQWQYVPDITQTEQLWANFKQILEKNNQDKIDEPLSDNEFAQVKKQIDDLETPYLAGKFLYGLNGVSQVEIDMDDGRHIFLTVFDQANVGAGNTVYQVVNQIERPHKLAGYRDRRFDTTLLINGLPIIHIEEKAANHNVTEALNQMEQYATEGQFTDIYSTVQILIGMTPDDTRYMANTTADKFNFDFAFHWQREDNNQPVMDWRDFLNRMLSIPMAHQMATNYMILDGTQHHQMLKVMRPYQVYATRKVIQQINEASFNLDSQKLGYIWHTTGSGKTISSFKTAWLASRLPNVDKVVFIVDRIALTQQTVDNYSAYDPDTNDENKNGVVTDTANVSVLGQKIRQKGGGIVVTSIQKLDRLVQRANFKKPDQHIVFIVDEAHRSTSGDMLQRAKAGFPHGAWVGYTGTPSFDGITTQEIFGDLLHAYTIREAIADRNVLGFKVDFNTTLSEDVLKEQYLPAFYQEKHPDWTQEQIKYKIDHLSREDMDDSVNSGVYDDNDDHVKLVVDDILNKWRNRSVSGRYSAMLTTHVGGGKASSPMAIKYFEEFQRRNAELPADKRLKVAVTFSQDNSNGNHMLQTNQGLHNAMAAYNELFGTAFGDDTVREYTEDVVSRLNRSISTDPEDYLNIVIVIDQLLTGFDAPYLNTLYVDRTMQGANLIQAYSRTNRIQDMQQKPYGRIVNYRWPAQAEKLMNEALRTYADRNSANIQIGLPNVDKGGGGVIAPDVGATKDQAKKLVKQLAELTDGFDHISASEAKQDQTLDLLKQYNHAMALLKQDDSYDYDQPDKLLEKIGITPDQEVRLTNTIANNLTEAIVGRHPDNNINYGDFDLQMEHVNEVKVNYDYLEELIAQFLNETNDGDQDAADETFGKINDMADQLTDRQYGQQVKRMAADIHNGQLDHDLVSEYPVKSSSIKGILAEHNQRSRRTVILAFRQKWGLVDAEGVKDEMNLILDRHITGNDDLSENNELTDIITKGQRYYKTDATDKSIQVLSKIKYRNQLRSEFTKFADQINQEFKEQL